MKRVFGRTNFALAIATLSLSVAAMMPLNARALTFVIDFANTGTDIFSQQTGSFNSAPYGFSGLNNAQAQQGVLTAIVNHFRGYPTMGADAMSPLANGFELDIDFEIGSFNSAPTNGDSDWWSIKVGDGLSGDNATDPGVFGSACLRCVRDENGNSNIFNQAIGAIVGSIWTDHIDDIANLAGSDSQLINLIAGTISHEIGHTLSLVHMGAQSANPGQSLWGVMGSGATSMPNVQRVLDRAFTYDNMGQLIDAVGTRAVSPVPLPAAVWLFASALGGLSLMRRRRVVA